MVVGLLQVEVHLPHAQSLKDKRAVLRSLKDQLRGRFNIAVAEVEASEKWQRATLGISTLAESRVFVERLLRDVTDWLRQTQLVAVIRIDQEYW